MKAIVTKYHGATNTRGARISATVEGGKTPHRVYIPYPHELNRDEAHALAASTLCDKLQWVECLLVSGGLPNGDTVHVLSEVGHEPHIARGYTFKPFTVAK